MSEQDKRMMAYHEAGHVICAELVGATVEKVTIVPGEPTEQIQYGGRTQLTYKDGFPWGDLLDEAVLAYAGLAAENRLKGIGPNDAGDAPSGGGALDILKANDAITDYLSDADGDYDEDECDRLDDHTYQRAAWHVEKRWRAVEAIAEALLRQGTLTGEEVSHILATVEAHR